MKKLLTILAASAMFFAFGDETVILPQGINFESFTATGEGSFSPEDPDDPVTGYKYWYSSSTVGNVISNHVNGTPDLPAGVTVPDMFAKDGANDKYLYLETEAPLFRTVGTNSQEPTAFTNVSIATEAIYLDTLVKFTAADSAFTSFEDATDKIAIEYVEHEEESHEDQTTGETVIDSAGFTNFVIRAGYVDGSSAQTNYLAAVPAGFDKDKWHRLTVRSISDVGGGYVGFVVYLDQVPLEYATSVAAGNAAFVENLNSAVTANFYNENIHALYPSAVRTGANKTTISAVAFSGNGSIDDVVFTTTKPGFINESSIVTVTWDEHVATLTLNGNAVEGFVAGTAGNANVEPENGVVLVAATFANGWEAGTFTINGDGSWDSATSSFINLSSGDTCNIVSMQPLYSVSDGVTTTKYDKLTDAIAAAQTGGTAVAPKTFALLANCSEMIKFTSGYVILDLAGHDIQGKNNQKTSVSVTSTANVIVTNSVPAEGAVKMTLKASIPRSAMALEDTSRTAVYCVKFDGTINTGSLDTTDGDFSIYSGTFLDADAEGDPAEFTYKSFVKNGASVTAIGNDYFQVGTAAPQPTTYTLTITVPDHTAVTYKIGDGEATAYTEAVNVASNAAVTITADPDDNYTYENVDLGQGWTLSGGNAVYTIAAMEAATTVVVPAPEEESLGTYQVTVIPTNNTTYAAVYTNDNTAVTFEKDVAAITVGYAIMITVTPDSNYEYASAPAGWTAGANGVITKVVDEPCTVEIPGPTAKSNWPAGWNSGNEPASMVTAFNAWIGVAGNDPTAANAEAAFLVGVNLADYTNDFAAASISIVGGEIVITGNYNLSNVNGALAVKMGDAPNALGEPTAVTAVEGAISLTPALGETKKFYKLVIGYPAN